MSSKHIYFYENIITEVLISMLKLRSSYASEFASIYKNKGALYTSWLYTSAFICNFKHFRYWRHQQCLSYELFEKSSVLFVLQLYSACRSLICICSRDSKTIYNRKLQWGNHSGFLRLKTATLHQHLSS